MAVAVDLIQRMKARELDADISLNTDQPASPRSAHSRASAVVRMLACLGLLAYDTDMHASSICSAANRLSRSDLPCVRKPHSHTQPQAPMKHLSWSAWTRWPQHSLGAADFEFRAPACALNS